MEPKIDASLERLLQCAHLAGIDVAVHVKAIERRLRVAEINLGKTLAAQA